MQLAQPARSLAKSAVQALVRVLAGRPATRGLLNAYYNGLSPDSKAAFHRRFAEIFLEHDPRLVRGEWVILFMGSSIHLPLRPEQARLDWAAAVSILGHETEIKSTYEFLLGAPSSIDVFLDVGANYGTHSMLFASRGVKTIAFEPNPQCLSFCEAVCELNRFEIRRERVAIGDHDGRLNLVFPDGETWLGTLVPKVADRLAETHGRLITESVELTTLDRFADGLQGRRVLLKIDVEGGEIAVLKGAARTLEQVQPVVIFETNDVAARADLWALLNDRGYRLFDLPFYGERSAAPLDSAEFFNRATTNFIALPRAEATKATSS
jgi:FkbM family methyltransferase